MRSWQKTGKSHLYKNLKFEKFGESQIKMVSTGLIIVIWTLYCISESVYWYLHCIMGNIEINSNSTWVRVKFWKSIVINIYRKYDLNKFIQDTNVRHAQWLVQSDLCNQRTLIYHFKNSEGKINEDLMALLKVWYYQG